MSYISLRERSRYLHDITKGVGREVRTDEITSAQDFADAVISGKLGKTWTTTPPLIERIADMLASAKVWEYLQSGQNPSENTFTKMLKDEAMGLLKAIVDGDIGIILADGKFDPDYPGESANIGGSPEVGTVEIII